MLKILQILFVFVFLFSINSYAQRILIDENFENAGLTSPDSLPTGWLKYNEDGIGGFGADWATRDSGTGYVGTSEFLVALAHEGVRSLTIPWTAGNGGTYIADDWVITDSLHIQSGDSLIFWMIFGSYPNFQPYMDSLQIWTLIAQLPAGATQKITTLFSFDSNNVWTEYKFDLSQFAGQTIYLGFRYNMDVFTNGFHVCIDDVFVGNHAGVGIQQIGTNIPDNFALNQNYPNPFNPTTTIRFDLAKNTSVNLVVYNSLGQEVTRVFDGYKQAGTYEAVLNASGLSSGTYYYRLTADNFVETKKMIVVK